MIEDSELVIIEVAVVTRFGHGRSYETGIWNMALDRLGLPFERTRVVVMDNTCERETSERLCQILEGKPFSQWAIFKDWTYKQPKEHRHDEEHVLNQVRFMNRLVSATNDSQYILTLDSDILPPTKAELNGVSAYDMLKSRMEPDVAVVGTPALSRWAENPKPSVYTVDRIEPWGKLSFFPAQPKGIVSVVNAFGMACTLWRGDPIRKYGFRQVPNCHATSTLGMEWYAYKMFHLDGFRLLCDWSIRPRHYKTETEYVQA